MEKYYYLGRFKRHWNKLIYYKKYIFKLEINDLSHGQGKKTNLGNNGHPNI